VVPSPPIQLAQIHAGFGFGNSSPGCGDYLIKAGWHVERRQLYGMAVGPSVTAG
jgi:hypothetical protein